MNLKAKCCTLLLFCMHSVSYGQMDQYKYARPLTGINGQWHQVILPAGIVGKVRGDLADLRIYGITENKDTVEAPYLLLQKMDQIAETEIPSKLINTVQNERGYYVTFALESGEAISLIKLAFGQDNFDWKIQLEGSQDQQEWFRVLADYRILSIKNKLTDFQFTDLIFPMASYRYFRLLIPNDQKPDLKKAISIRQENLQGEVDLFPIVQTKNSKITPTKQTEVQLTLENPVPISRLRIHVTDKFDYYRPLTLSYLADSVKTQQGWKHNYRRLASGTLNSLGKNEFNFESTILQTLKITIENQDNQALNLGGFEVKGFVHKLMVRFTQPANYFLVYGNDRATVPRYDIQQFAAKIPDNPPLITLGNERQHSITTLTERLPLFQNKIWLWSIMALIIGILGWFTLSMMQKK